MKNSTFLKTKEASPRGFNRYTQELNNISNSRISGISGVLTTLVVGVVIGVVISYILYLKFKPHYSESKADLKGSDLLWKALKHLKPKERELVKFPLCLGIYRRQQNTQD